MTVFLDRRPAEAIRFQTAWSGSRQPCLSCVASGWRLVFARIARDGVLKTMECKKCANTACGGEWNADLLEHLLFRHRTNFVLRSAFDGRAQHRSRGPADHAAAAFESDLGNSIVVDSEAEDELIAAQRIARGAGMSRGCKDAAMLI